MRKLAFLMLICWAGVAARAEQPNVLLILADDLGYSDLSCFGGEIPTPNIDRLAAGGLRFTQCYNSARCCPSRASLMTGLYPHQAGIGSFAQSRSDPVRGPAYLGHLNDRCVTLAEVLSDAGYQTYMAGKWHMEEPGPIERGFDEFYGYVKGYEQDQWDPARYVRLPEGRPQELRYADGKFYATDVFTDYALEFLSQARRNSDQPWLLYLAHSSPHFPVQAPRASVEKFTDTYRRGWDVLRQERFARMQEIGLADESWSLTERSPVPLDREDIANGYSGQPNPEWESLPEDRREDLARRMATFAAMVWHVDQGVGRIVQDLEAHGELDNTLILFLSDNGACYEWGPFGFDGPSRRGVTKLHTGEALAGMGGPGTYHSYGSGWANLCNTPFRLYKHFAHEGGNCTPLIAHWPDRIERPNRWVRQPIHVMDILPTLCEIAGTEYPKTFRGRSIQPAEGQSLVPLFRNGTIGERAIASEHNGARSLRRGNWKAVWPVRMPWESRWELYDLSVDRCEQNDLAQKYPKRTQELADEWMAWAKRVKVYPFYEDVSSTDERSPAVANRPLKISCEVTLPEKDASGVLLAQGGSQHGYALHIQDGMLHFSVRIDRRVVTIAAPLGAKKSFSAEATLESGGAMTLSVDGEVAARGKASGLIPAEPVDRLSVRADERSPVGSYQSPFPFSGQVEQVRIEAVAEQPTGSGDVPAPLFADPNYHGSCDPEIIWNEHEQEWWVFYTARRAKRKAASYVGTPIGVAASKDMRHWRFVGYCSFDGVPGRPDNPDTRWAPGIIRAGDTWHMFVTYKNNANPPWGGDGEIVHYTAPADDLLAGWTKQDVPSFTEPDPIDATLIPVNGGYRAYYRVGKGGGIHWAESLDLVNWTNRGPCPGDVNDKSVHGLKYQEAPHVFRFGDAYWMLTDGHDGLAVYRSPDGITWTWNGRILQEPGTRSQDHTLARHPSAAVVNGRAFLFYHVEPNRPYPSPPAEQRTLPQKLSYLQMAELRIDGGRLICDRNEPIRLNEAKARQP